jgi:hypothetical protein
MPGLNVLPKHLKAFAFHGVDIDCRSDSEEAIGECPFCGRDKKFYVNVNDGRWQCKSCMAGTDKGGGNSVTFIRLLWEKSLAATEGYEELAHNRGLLNSDTLREWGVCRSSLTGEWLVPGFGLNGKLNQLYRYAESKGRMRLYATPELPHGLHGYNLYLSRADNVYVCEGPWDGMILWETLRYTRKVEGGYKLTGSPSSSLLENASVLAVPGCGVWADDWYLPLANKIVYLLYDSDHPRKHPQTGQTTPPVGYEAMKRVTRSLAGAEERPREVHYLNWGEDGYDPSLPDGTDVRDLLRVHDDELSRVDALGLLLVNLSPVPGEWWGGGKTGSPSGCVELEILPCTDWKTLVLAWRKAMKWGPGLDRALSVMLACLSTTRSVGDQLWVKIISPPSGGKSTLCEALSVNKKYVLAKSTIRGFHSGFKSDKSGSEDNSLAALARNKCLVIKDGDTLLQSPNLSQILAEARDVYDRVSRTHYRNKMSRDYEGLNMTWILCGTESLRALDSSELGERFLDCVIMTEVEEDEELATSIRIGFRAAQEMSFLSDGTADSRDRPELVLAKRLTGGYVEYLCSNAQTLFDAVPDDDGAVVRCAKLGMFVSYMRARPSLKQEESVTRELSYRLASQHVRLAKALAVVLNRTSLDEEVMGRVRLVALDTSRGRTFNIIRVLYEVGEGGCGPTELCRGSGEADDKLKTLIRFLKRLGMVKDVPFEEGELRRGSRWMLTGRLRKLYKEVVCG